MLSYPGIREGRAALAMLALWGCFVTPAQADLFTWDNGDPFEAEPLQLLEHDRVRLRLDDDSVKTVALAELSAESAYRVRVRFLAPSDAAGHLHLGEYMRSRQCYRVAMVEFRIARDLDASLSAVVEQQLAACSEAGAKDMLESALALDAAKRRGHARTMLEQIVDEHPETQAAAAARDLLIAFDQPVVEPAPAPVADLDQPLPSSPTRQESPAPVDSAPAPVAAPDTGHLAPPAADPAPSAAANAPPTPVPAAKSPKAPNDVEESAKVVKLFDQAVAAHQAAQEDYRMALRFDAEYNEGRARRAYDNAIARLEYVLQALDSVRRGAQSAKTRISALDQHTKSRDLLVRVYLSVAHLHAGATRISEAYRYCMLALSLDDGNEWALKLRQKITEHRLETRIVRKVPPANPADE